MTNHLLKMRLYLGILLALLLVGCRSQPQNTAPSTLASVPNPQAQVPAQPSTPTPVVLENGWYLYTDPEGEFSFSYPPTALVSAGQNPVDSSKNITIQFLLPDRTYQGMSLRVEPNPKQTQGFAIAEQLYEKNTQKPATAKFKNSLETIQVGGLPAVKAVLPGTNTEITLIIPYEKKVLFASPVHDTSATQVDPEALELFYQVLNSLKFAASS
jgi:hypothetical protein